MLAEAGRIAALRTVSERWVANMRHALMSCWHCVKQSLGEEDEDVRKQL